jgi:hypothetical protein
MNFSESSEELLKLIINTTYLKTLETWTNLLRFGLAPSDIQESQKITQTIQDQVFLDFENEARKSLSNELDIMLNCFKNQKFKNIEKLIKIVNAKDINLYVFRRQPQMKYFF